MYIEVYEYTRPLSGTKVLQTRTTIRMAPGGGTTPENHSVNQPVCFIISSAAEKIEFICRFFTAPNDPYIAHWHITGYEEDVDTKSLPITVLPYCGETRH